jgi:hypothetical protein
VGVDLLNSTKTSTLYWICFGSYQVQCPITKLEACSAYVLPCCFVIRFCFWQWVVIHFVHQAQLDVLSLYP